MMRSKCASCRPTCGPNAHPGGNPQGKELLARRRQSMTRTPDPIRRRTISARFFGSPRPSLPSILSHSDLPTGAPQQ
jgi:hypothetical protein